MAHLHIARGVGRVSDMVVNRAKGSYLFSQDGRKILDMTSGIGVVNTGHCHDEVVKAAQKQCETLVHGQVNLFHHDKMLELVDVLLPVVPKGLDSIFFTNSGAEAVENAIKMSRHYTGKPNVIVMQGGYHGRTIGTMAMTTSSNGYRQRFGPLMPGVYVTPFPYEYHGVTSDDAYEALELLVKQQAHPDEVAALVIEPVLGEGGYVPAPANFLARMRKFCDKNKILLIFDEVQTGFGRTGDYFACDSKYFGHVCPDILVAAKGIASGFPLSCVVAKKHITDSQLPGSMGGTYAGNAVACAAAIATQHVIAKEQLIANSCKQGALLKSLLTQLKGKFPETIGDVRGLGCMVGVEMKASLGTKSEITNAALKRGMLILGCSVYETMRFIPPLTVNEEEIKLAVNIFEDSLVEVLN